LRKCDSTISAGILRPDPGTPDAFGIDHEIRTVLAQFDGPALRNLNGVSKPARADLAAEGVDRGLGASRMAARQAVPLLLGTGKDVVAERLPGATIADGGLKNGMRAPNPVPQTPYPYPVLA